MTGVGYWVDLHQEGTRLGGGFLVTRRFVLTALHCLRGLTELNPDLDILLADGTCVTGHVRRQDKDADLALIEISAGFEIAQTIPAAGVARGGDRWRGPYRPGENEVELSGQIDNGAARYRCEGGASIEALQLTADQQLGSYSGYSGGPVEGLAQEQEPTVVGILLEQVPDRADVARNTNVLFAATIREAMRRFDHFDVVHLIDVLRPDGPRRPPRPDAAEGLPSRAEANRLERLKTVIHTFRQLSAEGVMDPAHVAELGFLAVTRIVEEDHDGGGP